MRGVPREKIAQRAGAAGLLCDGHSSFCVLNLPSSSGLVRPFGRGRRPRDVPTDAQGAWPELVGQSRCAGRSSPGDGWHLQAGSAPHVFGILALGSGAGVAAAQLGCRLCRPDRVRDIVLWPRRSGRGRSSATPLALIRRGPIAFSPGFLTRYASALAVIAPKKPAHVQIEWPICNTCPKKDLPSLKPAPCSLRV
jgi:hypothetical protein